MELLDIYFKSNNANDMTVEVFNSFNTFANVRADYSNPASPDPAYNPYPIFAVPNSPALTNYSNMVWGAGGELNVTFDNGNYCMAIESIQYPYKSLLEALKVYKIKIHKIRMGCINNTQLVQPVTLFRQQPLTNNIKEEGYTITINPFNYVPSLNDWEQELTIDGSTGLRFTLEKNTVLSWNIHFDFI